MKSRLLLRAKRFVLGVFLTLAALPAAAVSIVSNSALVESTGTRYFFRVSDWTIRDPAASWCNGVTNGCWIAIIANINGTRLRPTKENSWVVAQPARTMGDLLKAMMERGFRIPYDGSLLVPREATTTTSEICITFAVSFANTAWLPVGTCTPVTPPILQCDITGNTNLEHGNLADNAVNGAQATTQLSLQCTGITQVSVRAGQENPLGVRLRDDNSLYSRISINDKAAAEGVLVSVAANQITRIQVKSTLVTSGQVEPGPFSGSTVLTVTLP